MGDVVALRGGQNPAEFVGDAPPQAVMPWICMDDRLRSRECEVLPTDEPYYQHAGGAHGYGQDGAAVMEVRRPGSFTGRGQKVHLLTKTMVAASSQEGIQLLNHERCAAFLGAEDIMTTAVTHPEAVYASAVGIKPDLTTDRFEQFLDGYGRILQSGALVDVQQAAREMQHNYGDHQPAIPMATLIDEHVAPQLLIDYRPRKIFYGGRAHEAGAPAYYESFGEIDTVVRSFRHILPFRAEEIQESAAIRMAAIREQHLFAPDGSKLQVQILDQAA